MNEARSNTYEFDQFRLDPVKRLLKNRSGETVALSPKVFDLLLYLVTHGGRVVDKDELMSAVWTDTIVEESNLSQNVSILRRALGEKRGEHQFIATIPGKGYKFVSEVRAINGNSEPSGKEAVEIETDPLKSDTPQKIAGRASRFRILSLTVLCVLGLGLFGFY